MYKGTEHMQKTYEVGNREIKALIFDMDNTLFDFVEAKLRACEAAVACVGRDDNSELVSYFLKDKKDVENLENIARYLRDRNIYTKERFETCCEEYSKIKLATLELYDGVTETLEKLRSSCLKLGLVTDAFKNNTDLRLEKTDLARFFDVIVTAEVTGKKKPDPEPLIYAMEKLGASPKETILIGDSLRRDIEPARKLGMLTVYASYGDRNFFEDLDCHADYVIKSICELLDIVGV
jgi:putative hydrolase of the HAD superfamily